jgi:hypothetical protein
VNATWPSTGHCRLQNEFNYGAGIEQTVADRWSIAGGWFRNSEYRGSAYAYGRYAVYKTSLGT